MLPNRVWANRNGSVLSQFDLSMRLEWIDLAYAVPLVDFNDRIIGLDQNFLLLSCICWIFLDQVIKHQFCNNHWCHPQLFVSLLDIFALSYIVWSSSSGVSSIRSLWTMPWSYDHQWIMECLCTWDMPWAYQTMCIHIPFKMIVLNIVLAQFQIKLS